MPILPGGRSVLGTTIGNYEIRRLIGEGGMGKVYLAVHPGIDRQAAVKVLAGASDPSAISRFITEARAANAIHHPNIVDVYDCGVLPEGTPYIVMEYLDGESLEEVLKQHRGTLQERIDWAYQMAEALSLAHSREVVHRDLKTGNIYLIDDARRPGFRQVKILDFGLAKLKNGLGQVHHTRTGVLMGTPLYMSPEQCMGSKDLDARTDIYSFGVILYELACHRLPFESESVYALMNMHVCQAPVPPSHLVSGLPDGLEAAIMACLAKRPEHRPSTMNEVLSVLSQVLMNLSQTFSADTPHSHSSSAGPVPLALMPSATTRSHTNPVAMAPTKDASPLPKGARGRRLALAAVGVVVAAGLGGYFGRREYGTAPPAPTLPVSAPVALPVTTPAPAPEPMVEISLDSVPQGAHVLVGGVVIATTPAQVRTPAADQPVEFVFQADGHQPARIRALVSSGLKLHARLEPVPAPAPVPAPVSGASRRNKRLPSVIPPADIKSER